MAEEGNMGVARALDPDEDAAKEDLRHRIEEARESIKETVTEIRESVVNQYDSVKESVTGVVDWREQVRKRPVAWSLGALGVGILVGYGLAGLIEREDEPVTDAESELIHSEPIQYEAGGPSAFTDQHSYATHARAIARVGDERSGFEEDKSGIIGRFKETRAYDRLQEEVSDLGNRFMDRLVDAARSIVVPALFNKVKEIIGIDMSNKRSSANAATRQPDVARTTSEPTRRPAAEAIPVIPSSESGKAAYPKSTESLNKFDRLASDKPATNVQDDGALHTNMSYDDRYERESKLFRRGEDRGSGARAPGTTKATIDERRSIDRNEMPRGKDFIYEPGHSSDSAES